MTLTELRYIVAVALAWRKSFPRPQAVEALRLAVLACKLPGVAMLGAEPRVTG